MKSSAARPHAAAWGGLFTWFCLTTSFLVGAAASQEAQVLVEAGQALTDAELTAGEFQGQSFTLGPDTLFEVQQGGVLGPVSDPASHTGMPFDFGGSSVTIRPGGALGGAFTRINEVSHVTLDIYEDARVESNLVATASELSIHGGTASYVETKDGGKMNIGGGVLSDVRVDRSELMQSGGSIRTSLVASQSTVRFTGGAAQTMNLANASVAYISGGTIGRLSSSPDSMVNLSGGSVDSLNQSFGALHASGGTIGRRFSSSDKGDTFVGGEFYLDGIPYQLPTISFTQPESIFSGSFADGSPFVFSSAQVDQLRNVKLERVDLPPLDTTPLVVDAISPPAPNGLRRGQSLTLGMGGSLERQVALVGAAVAVDGGRLGDSIDAYQSQIQLRKGTIAHNLNLLNGSTLQVSGGRVERYLRAYAGGVIDVSGGHLEGEVQLEAGSSLSISGGSIGDGLRTGFGTADVTFYGGDFQLNGAPFTGDTITLSRDDSFTGAFQDGSPFVFRRTGSTHTDQLQGVALVRVTLPEIDLVPLEVSMANDPSPSGLRAGQTLTLSGDGSLDENFEAVDATLNVSGGRVGNGMRLAGSVLTATGGIIGDYGEALHGSVVNIDGGSVGAQFRAESGSTVNLTDGSVGPSFFAASGSVVNLSGGSLGATFRTEEGASLNLHGGEFQLNGVPFLGDVLPAMSFQENVFSGTLADGSTFVFANDAGRRVNDELRGGANLIRTALPELDMSPITIDGSAEAPKGLRSGQSSTLAEGGRLRDNFVAVDGTLNVEGGEIGEGLQLLNAQLQISGGTIGDGMDVRSGSIVTITGGVVGSVTAYPTTTVSIHGGSVDTVNPR
ncbi:MAG: hypothetical protein KDA61_08900, partial [Planctomycetales bacterium]|nr:hypothetical protein [Planctomycetales bacterium]